MGAHTATLHVRVDDNLNVAAAEKPPSVGLTVDEQAYDDWFRAKVQQALDDPRRRIPDEEAKSHFAARRAALRKRTGDTV